MLVEVRRHMAAFKMGLTPQPAAAPAQSDVAATTSVRTIKSQLWLETAAAFPAPGRIYSTLGQLADVLIALLTPAALVALAMGVWRVGADLGFAGTFLIAEGFFSHWQVWIVLSIGLKLLSSTLLAWGSRSPKLSEEN